MQLAVISEAVVRQLATRSVVLDAVRRALISAVDGDGRLFPVTFGRGDDWMIGLKSGEVRGVGALGFKYGSYFPRNRSLGMPSHSSTTVLVDPRTGFPAALVNATYLNGLRTAAADAAAAQALSRPDSKVLGVLGGGHQAEFEIRALAEVRPIELVKVWNRTSAGAQETVARLHDLGAEVRATDRREAIAGSDLLVTVTAAREPLVMQGEVSAGCHISAMGADQVGKQELDPRLVSSSRLFADLPAQSVTMGEFQHAAAAGLIDPGVITPLGDVLADRSPGRRSDDEITIFDSSGLALQDIVVAQRVVDAALQEGLAEWVEV